MDLWGGSVVRNVWGHGQEREGDRDLGGVKWGGALGKHGFWGVCLCWLVGAGLEVRWGKCGTGGCDLLTVKRVSGALCIFGRMLRGGWFRVVG
jgi:hypothetical protein